MKWPWWLVASLSSFSLLSLVVQLQLQPPVAAAAAAAGCFLVSKAVVVALHRSQQCVCVRAPLFLLPYGLDDEARARSRTRTTRNIARRSNNLPSCRQECWKGIISIPSQPSSSVLLFAKRQEQQQRPSNNDNNDDEEEDKSGNDSDDENDDEINNNLDEDDNDQDYDEDDNYVNLDAVSDAEALLACRAWLLHKRKLPNAWKGLEERKARKIKDEENASYKINNNKKKRKNSILGSAMDAAGAAASRSSTTFSSSTTTTAAAERTKRMEQSMSLSVNRRLDQLVQEFDYIPSHVKRSQAIKNGKWSDPVWKAQWYQNRWGNTTKRAMATADVDDENKKDDDDNDDSLHHYHDANSRESQQQLDESTHRNHRLEANMRSFVQETGYKSAEEFLAEPAVAAMTLQEIEEAIRTYVISNRKRSRAKQQKQLKQKQQPTLRSNNKETNNDGSLLETLFQDTIAGDSIHDTSSSKSSDGAAAFLKQKRQHRADRAVQLYQKRLENRQANKQQSATSSSSLSSTGLDDMMTPVSPPPPRPTGKRPADAMARIAWDLQYNASAGYSPTADDVRSVITATRMKGRRPLLIRVLSEAFQLRGRCIPVPAALLPSSSSSLVDDPKPYQFVTQSTVDDIGALLIAKIQEREQQQQQQRQEEAERDKS